MFINGNYLNDLFKAGRFDKECKVSKITIYNDDYITAIIYANKVVYDNDILALYDNDSYIGALNLTKIQKIEI